MGFPCAHYPALTIFISWSILFRLKIILILQNYPLSVSIHVSQHRPFFPFQFVQIKITYYDRFQLLQHVDMKLTPLIYKVLPLLLLHVFNVKEMKSAVPWSLQLPVFYWLYPWGIFKHVPLLLVIFCNCWI